MEKRHGWLHCAAVFIQCLSSAQGLRLFPVFCNCKQGAVNNPAHVSVPTLSEACPQGESPVARLGRKAHAHAALSHVAITTGILSTIMINTTLWCLIYSWHYAKSIVLYNISFTLTNIPEKYVPILQI